MSVATSFVLGISLSVDSFAASVGRTAARGGTGIAGPLYTGALFAAFEVTALVAGWGAGVAFSNIITAFDHWIAFLLLSAVGSRMVRQGMTAGGTPAAEPPRVPLRLIATAAATSVDAGAIGVSLAFIGLDILQVAPVVGAVSFVMAASGAVVGRHAGPLLGRRAEVAGGVALIAIGTTILIEHLTA